MKKTFLLFFVFSLSFSQNYTSYFTGNPNDATTNPQFGVCLMGGSSENDNAMQWFLNLANGGDVLVVRTSGSDGYNDYMFNQLGVNLNSVETIRIDNASGAEDPYVLQKLSQAEAIWFAGGDQAEYVSFFKNNSFENILNNHINVKQYPVGGISAGMAIMGEYYFDALNGTVTTPQALNNPFDSQVSLGISDFINIPLLSNTITDTHYDNPDRKGRHSVFLARIQALNGQRVFGIGLEEFTAACIDSSGIAHIYGEYPTYNDYAYFIQINCVENNSPENLSPNQALDWNVNQEAIKAYVVAGNLSGTNSFDLSTWESGVGGNWENWWVNQGTFMSQSATSIDCSNLNLSESEKGTFRYFPNPTRDMVNLTSDQIIKNLTLYDILGTEIENQVINHLNYKLNLRFFQPGTYLVKVEYENGKKEVFKILKE